MITFVETCFSAPVIPATVLLMFTMMYWMVVIVGAAGLDLIEVDLDIDGHSDIESAFSVGLVGLRFLNLGRVPLMVWITILALTWWCAAE